MRRGAVGAFAAAWVAGLVLACGRSDSRQDGGNAQSPCDDYFDALVGVACGASALPPDEVARGRGRYETLCQNLLALHGNGMTAQSLEACAQALKSVGCNAGTSGVSECTYVGSLPDGSPCNVGTQCQSGSCILSQQISDSGKVTQGCGTCVSTIPAGQPCAPGQLCVAGAECAETDANLSCTPVAYGDVGATCDGFAALCKTGLYCDDTSSQCTQPAASGSPCGQADGCAPSLVCAQTEAGPQPVCQDPLPQGGACASDVQCAPGLACSSANDLCTPIEWASGGETCGDVALCLIGSCPVALGDGGQAIVGGQCPGVIADGEPCDRSDSAQTCDVFADCINGVCQIPDSSACL